MENSRPRTSTATKTSSKDQFLGVALKPFKTVSWNVNYDLGQDHPDVLYFPIGGAPPDAPNIQGVPFETLPTARRANCISFDSFVNWQVSSKLALTLEGGYILQRLYRNSRPGHVAGGALYAQYQLTPKLGLTGRAEYLSDRGGLYTNAAQALKETTLTAKYQVADGFDLFAEWRRDFSNQPLFYTDVFGVLKKEQNTATLGLVWWWGAKREAW